MEAIPLSETLKLMLNYGFPSVALVLVCFAGWRLLLNVMKDAHDHQKELMTIIQTDLRSANETSRLSMQALNEFRQSVSEGMKYQREEHGKMIELLSKIEYSNGTK